MTFSAEHAERVIDLAEREVACCTFLTITTVSEGDDVTVEVTSSDPAATGVIALLSGVDGSTC